MLMASKQNDITGFFATQLIVPSGATLAILLQNNAFECNSIVKYFSGGSLELIGISGGYGNTYAGGSLVAMNGTGYLFGSGEAVSIGGPARYYLMATGATAVAYLLKGMGTGY